MKARSKPRRSTKRTPRASIGGVPIETHAAVSKERFARDEEPLRTELLALQYELRDTPHALLLQLCGPDRAAVLELTHRLTEWLDARYIDVVARAEVTDEERQRPYFWRYATVLPAAGRIAIVPFCWTQDALLARLDPKFSKSRGAADPKDLIRFEAHFAHAGNLLVKIWFHLTDEELRARKKRDDHDPRAPWDPDRAAAKRSNRLARSDAAEAETLRETTHDGGEWAVLHAVGDEARDLAAGRLLRDRLRAFLAAKIRPPRVVLPRIAIPDRLAAAPRPKSVSDEEYDDALKEVQGRLNRLAKKAYRHGRPTVILFEGADAAGKGGAIRRITKGLRAPIFDVVPISTPDEAERAHHWLWRFWKRLPRNGRVAIFDRSWYGRVLVERVEEFAQKDEWSRAYEEIRDFERWLVEGGVTLVKIWLEVSADEQERRFTARGEVPFKKYKLTPDDFRNRAKRPQYSVAANEMFARTSTKLAPWIVLQADDKNAVRLEVVRRVAKALERGSGTSRRSDR